ncbi:MAG TPA: hypothetical protein VK557_12835 [Pyrinomonadaceae bacterium]|nr:hypothetical protein [Pyrinomonadaceae bacterium]
MSAMRRKQVRPDELPHTRSPIKYLTENGFSIVRASEIDPSVTDSPSECHFLVQHDDKAEREIRVSFGEELIAHLWIRRRIPLSETSMFWLVCAEDCLANYLWERDQYPPDDQLKINELPPEQLMLALHWRDRD